MGRSYSQLSYGSSGSEVEKLQNYLNQVGNYGLTVDGQYGPKTQDAVKQYQSSNNLTVDGIAGNETWGSLSDAVSKNTANNSNNNNAVSTPQDTAQAAPDYSKYSYDPSTDTAYQQALAALQQATSAIPNYQASYDDQLQEIYNQIVNRDKFSYDLNQDALYQQYADQYQLMGQQASMDTMGQAAALTGGYGNSWASTAGNQAYQAYLQQLNAVVPELYGMALDQHNAETDKLLTQYSMLGDMADDEYGKYQDALSQYWQNVSYLKQNADEAYDRGYSDWLNSYQMGVDAENTEYSKHQAEYEKLVSLITSTGYAPTAAELQAAGMSKDQAAAYSDYYEKQNSTATKGGSTGGSGGSGGGGKYSSETAEIQEQLNALGANLTVDGIWGPKTQAAYEKYMGGAGGDGPENETDVPSEIENKVSSFDNNEDLASYLDGLTQSGVITEEQADALYAKNVNTAQTKTLKQLVGSTQGWTVVDDGGVNWLWGVDNNAIVKAPNGKQYRLDNLVDVLVSEGVDKSEAKKLVKTLQKNLGI